jgi:hypothetical protein
MVLIPIERRMLIRWCWNAEAEDLATEGHGISRKEKQCIQSRMRKRRLLHCAGEHNFLLHIFTSLKRKRRFLKEAKHFYREDAKNAKRQKAEAKSILATDEHGISRNQNTHTSFRAGCTHP